MLSEVVSEVAALFKQFSTVVKTAFEEEFNSLRLRI
jgi:hypothetical protein